MGILPDDKLSSQDCIEKPKKGKLRQFLMKSYHPLPSVKTAVVVLLTLGLIFIIIGAILISYSMSIVQYQEQYFKQDSKDYSSRNITIDIKKKMNKPIFLYYKVKNYYQNHRIYSLSKSTNQLKGNTITQSEADLDCKLYQNYKDIPRATIPQGKNKNDIAYPCGLIASTFIKDTFELYFNDKSIPIQEDKIRWDIDGEIFKNYDLGKQWLDYENEHFIVWMKTAAFEGFKKLWGRIDQDLEKGKYNIVVNLDEDNGISEDKYVVLATANSLGGDNLNLGILYLVVGVLTISSGVYFAVRGFLCKKSDDFHG